MDFIKSIRSIALYDYKCCKKACNKSLIMKVIRTWVRIPDTPQNNYKHNKYKKMLIAFSILFLIIIVVFSVILLIIKLTNVEYDDHTESLNDIALTSVVPGSILCKPDNTDNPFENEKYQIKVVDIKKNGKNEIWLKYIYIDELVSNTFVPTVYYDKLENMLQSHPIVKLPSGM